MGATDDREIPAGTTDDVDTVTRAVLTASRLLVAVSARSLAAVEDRVTLPQLRMLVALSTRGATKLVALAELLQVAPSTAMRMIDRLIAAGLADRRPNPVNRRETLLQLTDEGRRTVEDVTARRRTEIAAIVERLDPAQRTALIDALAAFNEAGGEPPAPAAGAHEPFPLGWEDGLTGRSGENSPRRTCV
ncbi:MarR family transcriptional regulator [Streptomyces sp. Tu 6176]|uniref:MarR family winged helix-turn-helix transcriptional regulator n=1 Tax=Streptomyces sp. Tu 6176 TaxID=1470557 RepID=UPI0003A031F8|nr:MarR family transcriptional regulator [Streptomyces sp. Tu 6176]EYT80155.1 MarR family transcriptional regulator [Streptomyces sp. Tu 6176]